MLANSQLLEQVGVVDIGTPLYTCIWTKSSDSCKSMRAVIIRKPWSGFVVNPSEMQENLFGLVDFIPVPNCSTLQ